MKTLRPLAGFGLSLAAVAFVSIGRFEPQPHPAAPSAEQIDAAVNYAYASGGLEEDRNEASR